MMKAIVPHLIHMHTFILITVVLGLYIVLIIVPVFTSCIMLMSVN